MNRFGSKLYVLLFVGMAFVTMVNVTLINYFKYVSTEIEEQIAVDKASKNIVVLKNLIVHTFDEHISGKEDEQRLMSVYRALVLDFETNLKILRENRNEIEKYYDQIDRQFSALKINYDESFILRSAKLNQTALREEVMERAEEALNGIGDRVASNEAKIRYLDLVRVHHEYTKVGGGEEALDEIEDKLFKLDEFFDSRNVDLPEAHDYIDSIRLAEKYRVELVDLQFKQDKSISIAEQRFADISNQALKIIGTMNVRYDALLQENEIIYYASAGGVAVAFVISLLFMFYIVRSILKPIVNLTEAAERVAGGDLESRVEVISEDEIGSLSRVFNEMLDEIEEFRNKTKQTKNELEELNSKLEEKVLERTKELEEVRLNLEKTVEQRTAELKQKLEELEKFRELTVGRELKMIELKNKLDDLQKRSGIS